jgi:glycine/D-amino acid oxidase-like deaminating enzyme
MSLLQIAISCGLNLQAETPVLHISDTCDVDGRWAVLTTRGIIKATKIVFATNGYTADILPQFTDKIIPVRGTSSWIVVEPCESPPHLPGSYCLWLPNGNVDCLMQRHDGSVIVGGAKSSFFKERSSWYDMTDDGELIKPPEGYEEDLVGCHLIRPYLSTVFCF